MRLLVCDSPDQVLAAQALRYEVYAAEKGWVDPDDCPDGLEADEFDPLAVHFLAVDEDDGTALGTVRLLLGARQPLPAASFLDLEAIGVRPEQVVEVSRLATRRSSRAQDLRVFLGLTKLLSLWATAHSMVAWVAVADVPLYRLLHRLGLPELAVGSQVLYMGSACVPVAFDVAGTGPALDKRGAAAILDKLPSASPDFRVAH